MNDFDCGKNQEDLKKLNNEGENTMENNTIQNLFDEVELYKQAIQDAKDALASAEQELDETLDAEYRKSLTEEDAQ